MAEVSGFGASHRYIAFHSLRILETPVASAKTAHSFITHFVCPRLSLQNCRHRKMVGWCSAFALRVIDSSLDDFPVA